MIKTKRAFVVVAAALLCLSVVAQANVFEMPLGLTSLESVAVVDPGNKADNTGFGAVKYPFKMGKFEVTAAQWVEFLNAKAKSDTLEQYGLYDDNILESAWGFKLVRSGEPGSYTYTVEPGYANRPIVKVSFWDACRFCNWLHNGQGDGDTETGAYTLNGRMDDDRGIVRRNPGARWFIPSEDEWYKAAYYDPKKPGGAGYWDYPTRSNFAPSRDFSGPNSANRNVGTLLSPVTTVVGSFRRSASAYGTFDQGGNVAEWTESVGFVGDMPSRCQRGGAFMLGREDLMASSRSFAPPTQPDRLVGFRVACAVFDAGGRLVSAPGAVDRPKPSLGKNLWASPRELRKKKMIGTGQYSIQDLPNKLTARFLVEHPDFIKSHPFDGVTLQVPLDAAFLAGQGLQGSGTYSFLDTLSWSKVEVPYSAVQDVVNDLNRVSWGHLTDNFLYYSLVRAHTHAPDKDFGADFTNENDWAAVEHNASLMARICREANLKGFMLDTEQYGNYPGGGAYPMGKDSPDMVRKRGRQWIEAVQSEYPAITIVIFFAWSPDLGQAEFLAGMGPFLNGVLDGIKKPARLVHGYENSFYYGQGPNSRYTTEGFHGDRVRYQQMRASMAKWRALSSNPAKYDKFLEPGAAAWVESDPYDLQNPDASGSKETIWSNLPLALAYSDEYVWVWSERTNYGQGYARGSEPNPFMLSLSNETFNTGREAVASLTEDFKSNPLMRGWYFDFDMLDVGRRKDPSHAVPIFSSDAVPYVWSKDAQGVQVLGTWMTGPNGDKVAELRGQRRRYVHPIKPLSCRTSFKAELDFRVDNFGADSSNPIVLGLFNSDKLLNSQSIALQIGGPNEVRVVVAGNGKLWSSRLTLKSGLKAGVPYRLVLSYDGKAGLNATLKSAMDSSPVGQTRGALPDGVRNFELDEIGAAQWDVGVTCTPVDKAYRYLLERVMLGSK